jgi:DNA-binding transcriptional ArsR family regulator
MRTRNFTRESIFQQTVSIIGYNDLVVEWSFLTSHARALLCIADDPGTRLRDIAATLGITERRAFAIVTDLADAGYVVKERDGRRSRYEVQHHLPLREARSRERTIGDVLEVLADSGTTLRRRSPGRALHARAGRSPRPSASSRREDGSKGAKEKQESRRGR